MATRTNDHAHATHPLVLLDWPVEGVARLRINRPAKRNAIDHDVRQGLTGHLDALLKDRQVRALVIGGVEGVFSAGGDVASMGGLSEEQARERMQQGHVLCRLLASADMPVVSAVEGVGAGAAVGLALLGDHIVVGPGTKILFPFLRLGLVPDWGQLLTLPQRVGLAHARRIFTSGRAVSGEEAVRIGLADTLVPDAQVMDNAIEQAARLARLPRDAFARMKQRLLGPSSSLAEDLSREEADQVACLLGSEFAEGYRAFVDKREPDFSNLSRATPK